MFYNKPWPFTYDGDWWIDQDEDEDNLFPLPPCPCDECRKEANQKIQGTEKRP